jgi:hypothetical protein
MSTCLLLVNDNANMMYIQSYTLSLINTCLSVLSLYLLLRPPPLLKVNSASRYNFNYHSLYFSHWLYLLPYSKQAVLLYSALCQLMHNKLHSCIAALLSSIILTPVTTHDCMHAT